MSSRVLHELQVLVSALRLRVVGGCLNLGSRIGLGGRYLGNLLVESSEFPGELVTGGNLGCLRGGRGVEFLDLADVGVFGL